jgi:hypothetical protein
MRIIWQSQKSSVLLNRAFFEWCPKIDGTNSLAGARLRRVPILNEQLNPPLPHESFRVVLNLGKKE